MRDFISIVEGKVENVFINNQNVRVIKNPSILPNKKLRGIITTKDLYVWSAKLATHFQVSREIGVLGDNIFIFDSQVDWWKKYLSYEEFHNHPILKILLGNQISVDVYNG